MDAATVGYADSRPVKVWDAPTRLFHWLLLALIVVCWFTGEEEGASGAIHRYAGEAIAGLLVFRVVWGFVGGEHARFSDFAAGPAAIAAHIRSLFSREPKRYLGHNPLGGLAVFLLLFNVAVIVGAGLFSSGEGRSGPFAGLWGLQLSEVHEVAFRVLQGLVAIHIIGVAIETLKTRDALVPAMVFGSKRRRNDESGENARKAGLAALVVALAIGLSASAWLISLPHDTTPSVEQKGGEEYDD